MSAEATTYYDRKGLIGTLGRDGLIQIILVTSTIVMLAPIVIMIFSAFKSTPEIFKSPFGLPDFANVGNFVKIWTQTNFVRYLLNSFIVTAPESSPDFMAAASYVSSREARSMTSRAERGVPVSKSADVSHT